MQSGDQRGGQRPSEASGGWGTKVRRRAVQAKEPVRHRGDLSDQGCGSQPMSKVKHSPDPELAKV